MRLYLLPGGGLFATDTTSTLPACVEILPRGKHEVLLNGKPVTVGESGDFLLPDFLQNSVHTIAVDGTLCESVLVNDGRVRPSGEGFRRLLPALAHLHEVERRVEALEKKAAEKEVNWLL